MPSLNSFSNYFKNVLVTFGLDASSKLISSLLSVIKYLQFLYHGCVSFNSILLFFSLPAAVSFVSTGFDSPKLTAFILSVPTSIAHQSDLTQRPGSNAHR